MLERFSDAWSTPVIIHADGPKAWEDLGFCMGISSHRCGWISGSATGRARL
jgi:hypothetical protein